MSWRDSGPFVFFDLETTGLSPTRDRILQIGAVRLDIDGTVSRFETFVNPHVPIPDRVTAISGITDEMVANAPNFKEAAYDFLKFADKSKMWAHNARFDLAFLQESLARVGMHLLDGSYDTIPVIRRAYPGLPSYSLPSLRAQLPMPVDLEGREHTAPFDAEVTFIIFRMAMNILFGEE